MEYLRRTSNYLEKIALSNLTHLMIIANLVAISVETPRINNGCSLEKELTELISHESLNSIMLNYESYLFMSRLCMWSFDLRHQNYTMDGRSCFD